MIILVAIAGSYATAIAQTPAVVISDKAGWHKIGERHVSFKKDHDEILERNNMQVKFNKKMKNICNN